MDYDTRDVDSINMKACYPASCQGMGEAKPYFERFGHPSHHMTRVAINGTLPRDIGTGFAEVQEWEFEANCHPVIPAWFGRHFADAGWTPTPHLAFLVESGLLNSLKVREAWSLSGGKLKSGYPMIETRVQCQEIRKVLPVCLGWGRFADAWKPCDLILTSRLKVRDRAQKLLFERLARGSRRPAHLPWRPGTAAPYRRRNVPRLASRGCSATCKPL